MRSAAGTKAEPGGARATPGRAFLRGVRRDRGCGAAAAPRDKAGPLRAARLGAGCFLSSPAWDGPTVDPGRPLSPSSGDPGPVASKNEWAPRPAAATGCRDKMAMRAFVSRGRTVRRPGGKQRPVPAATVCVCSGGTGLGLHDYRAGTGRGVLPSTPQRVARASWLPHSLLVPVGNWYLALMFPTPLEAFEHFFGFRINGTVNVQKQHQLYGSLFMEAFPGVADTSNSDIRIIFETS